MAKRRLPTSWSAEEEQYLVDNYRAMPFYLIAEKIGRTRSAVSAMAFKLGLKRTKEEQREITLKYNRSCFQKGHKSWNKGMKGLQLGGEKGHFPKGHLPHNTRQDGATSIRRDKSGNSYRFVRVAQGKWVHEQRVRYEAVHGPIAKGLLLRCKDGDTLNTHPDNWYVITRREHARLNHNQEKAYLNGPFHNLSDNYVANLLTMKEPHLKEEIKKHPELLEVARQNLLLKREIKNLKNQ